MPNSDLDKVSSVFLKVILSDQNISFFVRSFMSVWFVNVWKNKHCNKKVKPPHL